MKVHGATVNFSIVGLTVLHRKIKNMFM